MRLSLWGEVAVRNPGRAAALVVGVACLGSYVATLSHWCWVGDSGELTADAAILGIPHPPGYPLYTLLGRVLLVLAPLKPAVVMNVSSAVASACAAGLLGLAVLRLGGGWASVFAGGLLYGLAGSTWRHSIVAEVYALHVMLAVLAFLFALRARRDTSTRHTVAACWVLGLGLAHHTSMVLLLPALGTLLASPVRRARESRRVLLICVGALVLGLTAYLYLPIRSRLDPANDWGNPESPRALWDHVTGRLYAGQMASFSPASVASNLRALGRFVIEQWPPVLLLLPAGGITLTAFRHRRRLLALAVAGVPVLAFSLTYRIPDIEPQFLPLTALGVVASIPVLRLMERRWWGRAGVLAAGLIPALWSFGSIRGGACAFPESYARAIMRVLPRGAALLCRGQLTPLLAYLQQAEKLRPDVRLVDQLGNLFSDPYRYRAAASPPNRHRAVVERELLNDQGRLFYVLRPAPPLNSVPCGLLFQVLAGDTASSPCSVRAVELLDDPGHGCLREPVVRELAVQYHLHLAMWASSRGKSGEAQKHLAASGRLAEGSSGALTAFADYYRELGILDQATTLYRKALRADREYLPAALGLAKIAPAEAHFALERAGRGAAGDIEALAAAAGAWLDAGRPAEAEKLAMQALELAPRDCEAALVLGNSLAQQGRLDGAEAAYGRALSVCPDLADAWANLCLVYGSSDRMEMAVEAGKKAVALEPTNLAALNNLGTTYARLGRLEEARPLWQRSLRIDPAQDRIRTYLESAPAR